MQEPQKEIKVDTVDTSIIEKIDTLPEKVPGGASIPAT